MEKITFKAFKELLSKDTDLKAKIDAIPEDDEKRYEKISEIVESLGYELLPDEGDEIVALTDDEIEEVAGGVEIGSARCKHVYKFRWKEEPRNGILHEYYKCTKCGACIRRSSRVK